MTARELVRLDGVAAGFGADLVLEDVDLTVAAGDFVGVVGPSGSGKTSLLRCVTGTLRPRSGAVVRAPGVRVGYVPQVETVDWNFPVRVEEVVLMARDPRRPFPWTTRAERRAAHGVLESLGIAGLAARHIRELSGGQQQRVFIARALLSEPDLLLLDEPTSGVDVATRHDVLHLLEDLNSTGLAVLLTTHDLNGVAAHLPTIVCLNRCVIGAGRPADVMTADVLQRTYGAPMEVLDHGGMRVVVDGYPNGTVHAGQPG